MIPLDLQPGNGRSSEPNVELMMVGVGSQVRSLRKQQALTLEQLSQRCGVSTGLLSQMERGRGNPSFNTLVQIAHALGAPVAQLLQYEPATSPVVRRHERRQLNPHPNATAVGARHELLTPGLDQLLEAVWVEAPPGYSTEDTPFTHPGEEVGIILEGRHEIHLGTTCHVLGPGDSITYPSSVPHWYRNPGPDTVKAVWIITPPTF